MTLIGLLGLSGLVNNPLRIASFSAACEIFHMSVFRYKSLILIIALLLVGCRDNDAQESSAPSNDAAEQLAIELEQQAARELSKQKREPLKKDLRVIGEGIIATPIIEADEVERVESDVKAAEKNAAETARIPKKPDLFPRPLVLSAGQIKSKNVVITFKGIELPKKEEICQSVEGEWPCGNFAKAALQRLVRSKTLSCEGEFLTLEKYQGSCKVGKVQLNEWLAKHGWAREANNELAKLIEEAKIAKTGLWRE